jgi:hypothetical protein
MDIHPPHEPVRSIKDFLYHMLTIVLGILIALSFEGLVEWSRHRSLVNDTRDFLTREISDNKARLKNGLARVPDAENRLRLAIQLAQARQSKREAPPVRLDLSFGLLALSSTNWNEAQASGALSLMDPVEVQRYTRIYVVQEHFLNMQDNTLGKWLELEKWLPFLNGGKGLDGLNDLEADEFKQEAAAALVYLQTEESIATTLNDEYGNVRINRP